MGVDTKLKNLIFIIISILYCSTCWAGITIDVTNISECKKEEANPAISYEYKNGNLILNYLNIKFNCCADKLESEVDINEDTIIIDLKEKYSEAGPCDCICPFDVMLIIKNIKPGKYKIIFDNSRLEGRQKKDTFNLELNKKQ